MAGFDMSTANNVLKRVQEGVPVEQMQSEAPYSKSRKYAGKGFGAGLFNSTQTARNQSWGIRNSGGTNDNEDMPIISAPTYAAPNYNSVRDYGRLYVSGKAASRALSNDEKQSFAKGIASQSVDLITGYWRDYDFRSLNSSSVTGKKSGVRGILNAAAYAASPGTAITFTLDVSVTTTARKLQLCQGIEPNMNLEVYESTGWTKVASILVSTVDPTTSTFTGTLSDALAATSDGFYLFRNGDFNRDIDGLGDIIDDGTLTATYGGLTSSGLWTGHVLRNGGALRDFSPAFMNQATLIARKENGDKPIEAWMSYGLYEQLLGYIQRTSQIIKEQGNAPMKANIGGDIEVWGKNITMKQNAKAPTNEMLLVQSEKIDFYEQENMGPVVLGKNGKGGDVIFDRIPGKDNWEALYSREAMQRSLRRNLNVKIEDLNQSAF